MSYRAMTYGCWLAAAILMTGAAAAQSVEQGKAPARIHISAPAGSTEILPTLKGHMARLGSLMNVLFRNIDETDRSSELVLVIEEMEALLVLSQKFKPDVALFEPDPDKEAMLLQEYQACLVRAREMLIDLRAELSGKADGQPRGKLLQLDQVRRDCHVAFG